ncbi:IP17263p [Anopheles sinensis]|uniref:IP17263p n=1 Tax=Anopheles sinensis TaxID=74873 RepID=A0A084W5G4_ANOSI|nr:IP17263p [Anopheles sinensis]
MYCLCRSSKTIAVRIVLLDETDFLHELQVRSPTSIFPTLVGWAPEVDVISTPHQNPCVNRPRGVVSDAGHVVLKQA